MKSLVLALIVASFSVIAFARPVAGGSAGGCQDNAKGCWVSTTGGSECQIPCKGSTLKIAPVVEMKQVELQNTAQRTAGSAGGCQDNAKGCWVSTTGGSECQIPCKGSTLKAVPVNDMNAVKRK